MISVIVPVYKVERYLRACVDSILAQTFSNFELILVDDGSPDECGSICEKYAEQDPRCRVIHQSNRGLSAARNAGIEAAHGDLITFVDSDDIVHPDYLRQLYNALTENGTDISVCDFVSFTDEPAFPGIRGRERILSGREAVKEIVLHNRRSMITSWGKLYRKSLREGIRFPEGKIHEDEFTTYQLFYKAESVVMTSAGYYGYRQNPDGIMVRYSPKRLDILDAVEESVAFFEKQGDRELADQSMKRCLLKIQYARYRVRKEMKDDRLAAELKQRHEAYYQRNRERILPVCSLADRINIFLFRHATPLYDFICSIVLGAFPEI